jgi:alkanesulfonate monooxygenase SsuD/methylene tetrahydromethanopterin reductase-like flavin-dependent oxidoreductase (luciferase family)
MKNVLVLALLGVAIGVPAGHGFAASNKDRITIGTRKSEEQPPQATETRQYCTEGATRVRTAAGRDKESMPEAVQTTICTSAPVSRSSDEARAETRKVERSPDN